ncbi:S-adenosyl-L-methionine-dependent methyltransferase [Daedalea quercina L-15889]|uniref:S-adenosyl-L-methionine-dependent methyltransferase n=1 Tax=Daedalea quercina L-15889 TaxID=1314783 RepID=A0A165NIH9_9APHY|nr:S-adenosyl-L-methionine-dependent methyltransferase [Daedalea quercina L-15889]
MAEQHPQMHQHDAQHEHNPDYAAQNKQFFDQNLELFERPEIVDATRRVAAKIRERYPSLFNIESTTVLDYACGTGLFDREWSSHVKLIFGVDISQKVVDEYNLQASKHGLSDKLKATCVELKADSQLDASTQRFDIVLCTMAFHHFASPEDVTKILASFLKPGGSLLVADLLEDSSKTQVIEGEQYKHVPHKSGFDEGRMQDIFTRAGLADFEMGELISGLPILEHKVTLFLARGVKPL